MREHAERRELRVGLTQNDRARLDFLADALEMTVSEVVRYYIRVAYAALGERVTVPGPAQTSFLPFVLPDGKTPLPTPIPTPPPKDRK
jgi:hypothetical protein